MKQKLLFLFSFVLIIDPSGLLFGIKDILFLLLLVYLFFTGEKYRKDALFTLIAVYAMVTITFLLGKAQGFEFNYGFTMFIYRTFVLLFLLGWIDRLKFLETIYFPTILVALISIIIYYIAIEYKGTPFFSRLYDFSNLPHKTFTISWRSFIGYDIMGVYYRSAPVLLLPLSIYCSKALNKNEKNIKIILVFLLLLTATLLSGTRALMLSGCGVVMFVLMNKMMNIYFWRKSVPVFIMVAIGMILYVAISLLSDKAETSILVKFGHLDSYVELFKSHPLILLLGQGAGSLFYSLQTGEYIPQTEWNYIEMLRMFGIFGFVLLFILYLYPAYKIWRQRQDITYAIPFLIGYLFYLFDAGTNPLLLGSNGLLVLMTAYSLAYNPIYRIVNEQT
jgi:hypothetical protein